MEHSKKFIIIDDDKELNFICTMAIKRVLGKEVEVISFTNAEEGVAYIKDDYKNNTQGAILLLDINMPILTGWDVLGQLGQLANLKNNMDIYVQSSSVDPNDKKKAEMNLLVSAYIEKPISKSILLSMV
jgi:response regulator RpfG family c-di-GMP phosphodiesterase